jgi:hypothetical protein
MIFHMVNPIYVANIIAPTIKNPMFMLFFFV